MIPLNSNSSAYSLAMIETSFWANVEAKLNAWSHCLKPRLRFNAAIPSEFLKKNSFELKRKII